MSIQQAHFTFTDSGNHSYCVLDEMSENAKENILTLVNRAKGTHFQVKEEKLVEVSFKRDWKGWLSYHFYKKEERADVKRVVDASFSQLTTALNKVKLSQTQAVAFRAIFSATSSLGRMSRKLFDRGLIEEGSALESIINPAMQSKRETLEAALQTLDAAAEEKEKRETLEAALQTLDAAAEEKEKREAKLAVEKAFIDLVLEELHFAQYLGIDLEQIDARGSGGARFGRDRYGKKIVVVKPDDEGPRGENNSKWSTPLKRFFHSLIDSHTCFEGNKDSAAEVDSWRLDRHFEIWSVPPTTVCHITSADFFGPKRKKCSVQMYVDGCQTLGEYIDVAPHKHTWSRPHLRYHCHSDEIINKIPLKSLQLIAAHNFYTEDIDCHFENILVKVEEPSNDSKIESVDAFFKNHLNQKLLGSLLSSEIIGTGDNCKKVTLIKPDGGSSNPHSHPSQHHLFSLRYKHLFEVLPQFDQPISAEAKQHLKGQKENFSTFLLEKGEFLLRSRISAERREAFLKEEDNKVLFCEWIFTTDPIEKIKQRDELIEALKAAKPSKTHSDKQWQAFLEWIGKNLQARVDSFQVASHFLENRSQEPFRNLFQIRSQEDFEEALTGQRPTS